MFNLTNLLISAASPLVIGAAIFALSSFIQVLEGVWGVSVLFVVAEHLWIGTLLGMDPKKFPSNSGSGGWFSLPVEPWLLGLTLLLDYLLLVFFIYLMLTIFTKRSSVALLQ
jgi:hypothetical protein